MKIVMLCMLIFKTIKFVIQMYNFGIFIEMLKSFLNMQVKIKNLKNDAGPNNKICSNISDFMRVQMKLCQSKQADLLFSASLA